MWNDIKWNIPEEEWDSSILRRANYQIEVQAMLLSIKIGLDRLVAIFHYYYKGFPSATTFGRYKNAKASGFMSTVSRLKATDKLMSFIDNEYHKWIHIAVFPRDTISHYNDLGITYHFDSETGAEIPIHYSNRLLQVKTEQETKEHSPVFHIENLREFAVNWYDFFDHVIDVLLTKPLIKQNPIL
jgi:hypothetical protein